MHTLILFSKIFDFKILKAYTDYGKSEIKNHRININLVH